MQSNYLKYAFTNVVLMEIPTEVSLSFSITGCPNRCPECHWQNLQDPNVGKDLTPEKFTSILRNRQRKVSCILFFGGEWKPEQLIELLKIARAMNFKTALYTGNETIAEIDPIVVENLDYIKVGPYLKDRGPINDPNTNQRLYNLITNEDITELFWDKEMINMHRSEKVESLNA